MVAQIQKSFKKIKRRNHAAATYCAPYKHRVRYKNAVEKSCGRCMDAVRTLCTANKTDHNIVIGIFIYAMTSYHFWHGEMTLYLLHGPRIPPVKIITLSDRFRARISWSIAKI